MIYNRLSDLFKELSFQEMRELAKYLRSPLFNQQQKTIELFEYMRKRMNRGWKNENIFKHLFPNERYDIKKIHHLNSKLLHHIESYLAWKEFKTDHIQHDLYLLKAYRKKNMDKSFVRLKKQIEKKLDETPHRNESYHHLQYQIQKEQFQNNRESGRTVEFNLQEISNVQDIHFISDKLKHACNILSHQTMYKKTYDLGLLDEVIKKLDKNPHYLELPAISIYYHAFMALSDNGNAQSFNALKKLLDQSIKHFFPSEQRDVYILAINFCIRRINSGDKEFMREVFNLYQTGLRDKVFIENGILSRWTYNNIIVAALKLEEFDWAENFIYDYKKSLDEKTREDSFNYNLAKFHFEKKDYQKTMPLLIQTKYDDLLHNLGAKTMLAKMYYELSEWDALDNLLDSFRVYISRKKDIGYHKENYTNIISFFKKMVKINQYEKEALFDLKSQITTTKILTEREWLLNQIEALIQNK